jgi:hypothetical protein
MERRQKVAGQKEKGHRTLASWMWEGARGAGGRCDHSHAHLLVGQERKRQSTLIQAERRQTDSQPAAGRRVADGGGRPIREVQEEVQ